MPVSTMSDPRSTAVADDTQITVYRSYLTSLRSHLEDAAAELANIRWSKEAQPPAASRVGATQAMIRFALTDLKRIVGQECETCEGEKVIPCRVCGGTGGLETVCSRCRGSGDRLCEACDGEGVSDARGRCHDSPIRERRCWGSECGRITRNANGDPQVLKRRPRI